ncbi:MAG: SEC-C metal-binding domain-containing protein [Chlamydiales bacterium]
MTKKIGRNDPCACGSGKKYKNCCMNKEQVVAKYTPSGKRKFKAKVIKINQGNLGLFDRLTPIQETPIKNNVLERMKKFRSTENDYQSKKIGESLKFKGSEKNPVARTRHLPKPDEPFNPTSEDLQENK